MTFFQILMLGASAFFAFRIYQHIQTLQDLPEAKHEGNISSSGFDPSMLIARADIAVQESRFQDALELLQEADAKDPNNAQTLFKLGFVASAVGRVDEAITYYQNSLKIDNNDEFVHNALASQYRKIGKFEEAQGHLQDSLAIDGDNAVTHYNYGNLLVDMGEIEKARESYENAIAIDSSFAQAREELEKLGKAK